MTLDSWKENMGIEKRLNEAAKAGEVITVVYHGGSQPGTKRRLSPIKATSRELRARDIATDEVKTFLVSKIEIVPDNHPAKEYVAGFLAPPKFKDLLEALGSKVKELEAMGWYVNLSESNISVHRYLKNGKPRKGGDAGISKYEEGSNRPWYVFGPDLATARTFSHLEKAVELFLEQAVSHAPAKQSD
jgi:hypothetical protein